MKANQGQVMLMTVIILSGTVLAVTTVAGVLLLNQIRQTTNVVDSTKAIFAADAGLEWEFYKRKNPSAGDDVFFTNLPTTVPVQFITSSSNGGNTIKSVGSAGNVRRALEVSF